MTLKKIAGQRSSRRRIWVILFLAIHLSSSRLLFVGFDTKEVGEQIKLSGVVNVFDLTEETWTQMSSPGFLSQLPAMLLLEDGRVMVSSSFRLRRLHVTIVS